jgi:predicted site-specific integrase-resolvase
MSEENLIGVAECAKRMGITPRTLRALVHAGTVPCIQYNSKLWRFHWPTVLAASQKL